MALVFSFNPERSMASQFAPEMSRQGYAEGTHTGLLEKGTGAKRLAQGGFKTYEDYMKAYRLDPSTYAKSYNPATRSNISGGYMNAAPIQGFRRDPSHTAFSEAEFNKWRQGQNIAEGLNLQSAAERAMAGIPDSVADYQSKYGGGNEFLDYYKNLLMNPQEMLNSPEYAFLKGQMEESVRRTSPRMSGQRAIAAQERAGQLASTFRGQTLSERLAGAEQERLRGNQSLEAGLQAARLKAELAMRPEEKIFDTYWRTSARG